MCTIIVSRRLKSHQPIIVVLFWIDKRRRQLSVEPPERALPDKLSAHLGSNILPRIFRASATKNYSQVFPWYDFEMTSLLVILLNRTWSLRLRGLYYIITLWNFVCFFFLFYYLPLFRRLHSSGKHLLRFPNADSNDHHAAYIPVDNRTVQTHHPINDVT